MCHLLGLSIFWSFPHSSSASVDNLPPLLLSWSWHKVCLVQSLCNINVGQCFLLSRLPTQDSTAPGSTQHKLSLPLTFFLRMLCLGVIITINPTVNYCKFYIKNAFMTRNNQKKNPKHINSQALGCEFRHCWQEGPREQAQRALAAPFPPAASTANLTEYFSCTLVSYALRLDMCLEYGQPVWKRTGVNSHVQ